MAMTTEEKRAAHAAQMREWCAKNREKVRARHNAAYAADPEHFRKKAKAWRDAHPDRIKQYRDNEDPVRKRTLAKAWRDANQERARELNRQSYVRNRAVINARRRERLATDPEFKARIDRQTKASQEKNREKHLAKAKERRLANPDTHRAAVAEYRRKNPVSWYLYSLRKHAKAKGLEFDLTLKWLQERFDKGLCELSGLPFDRTKKRGPNSPSIDRIRAGGPYTQANCRMILWCINLALSNYGEDHLIHVFRHVIARHDAANG